MLTYKLKIKTLSDKELVDKKQHNHSYAFRKLYSNYDKVYDVEWVKTLCKKYELDSWLFECLKTEVGMKINQVKTIRKNNENKVKEIKKELEELRVKKKLNKKDKRLKFKLLRKLTKISFFKDIVFGTKAVLRKISHLSNIKDEYCDDKKTIKTADELEKTKQEFKNNRLMSIFIGGETYSNGNRKVDFDLENNKIIVKPERNTKIDVEFYCGKNQAKELSNLQKLIEQNNVLPITIRLSTEYLWIMFDEEKLKGFSFNERDLKKELKKIPKKEKQARKEIAKKFHSLQRDKKLSGKLSYRYLAVDLNPCLIGWSICDFKDGKITIVVKGCYDLTKLSEKLGLISDNPIQVEQNNKRKYEISIIWKDLFKKAVHYKTAYFIVEDLEFKDKSVNDFAKEFNREVENIWHRTLTAHLINKYCNILGIQKIEINPCYTSFIGNIKYKYFDPVNASLEILRRGIFKFIKDSFLPEVTDTDRNTMSNLIKSQVRDVCQSTELLQKVKSLPNWRDLFYLFKQSEIKYRHFLKDVEFFKSSALYSFESKVVLYSF